MMPVKGPGQCKQGPITTAGAPATSKPKAAIQMHRCRGRLTTAALEGPKALEGFASPAGNHVQSGEQRRCPGTLLEARI